MCKVVENHIFSFDIHCNCQLFHIIQKFSEQNPDNEQLQRKKKHSFLEFREEPIINLTDLDQYAEPPLFRPRPPPQDK